MVPLATEKPFSLHFLCSERATNGKTLPGRCKKYNFGKLEGKSKKKPVALTAIEKPMSF